MGKKYEWRNCPLINNLFSFSVSCCVCVSAAQSLSLSVYVCGCAYVSGVALAAFSIHCNHLIHDNLFLIIVNPHVLYPIVVGKSYVHADNSFLFICHRYSCGCVQLRAIFYIPFSKKHCSNGTSVFTYCSVSGFAKWNR